MMNFLLFVLIFAPWSFNKNDQGVGFAVIYRVSFKIDNRFDYDSDYVRKNAKKIDTVHHCKIVNQISKALKKIREKNTSYYSKETSYCSDVRIVVDLYNLNKELVQSFDILSNRKIRVNKKCYKSPKSLQKILGIYRRERKLQRLIEKIFPPVWKIE